MQDSRITAKVWVVEDLSKDLLNLETTLVQLCEDVAVLINTDTSKFFKLRDLFSGNIIRAMQHRKLDAQCKVETKMYRVLKEIRDIVSYLDNNFVDLVKQFKKSDTDYKLSDHSLRAIEQYNDYITVALARHDIYNNLHSTQRLRKKILENYLVHIKVLVVDLLGVTFKS